MLTSKYHVRLAILALFTMMACAINSVYAYDSLLEVRKGTRFQPVFSVKRRANSAFPAAKGGFVKVEYQSEVGKLGAYLSRPSLSNKKYPAIVWIHGGNSNSIGDVWTDDPASNDQSVSPLRKAPIVCMFPSLRGGNTNPGFQEGFLGEVNDVLAAIKYLKTVPYVDPQRVYLGGHSTGGTLVLLVAESKPDVRAVFAFGPAADIRMYGEDALKEMYPGINAGNEDELCARSPVYWQDFIKVPVWLFEGAQEESAKLLAPHFAGKKKNPQVHVSLVKGVDHFGALNPVCKKIAAQILTDTGPQPKFSF